MSISPQRRCRERGGLRREVETRRGYREVLPLTPFSRGLGRDERQEIRGVDLSGGLCVKLGSRGRFGGFCPFCGWAGLSSKWTNLSEFRGFNSWHFFSEI